MPTRSQARKSAAPGPATKNLPQDPAEDDPESQILNDDNDEDDEDEDEDDEDNSHALTQLLEQLQKATHQRRKKKHSHLESSFNTALTQATNKHKATLTEQHHHRKKATQTLCTQILTTLQERMQVDAAIETVLQEIEDAITEYELRVKGVVDQVSAALVNLPSLSAVEDGDEEMGEDEEEEGEEEGVMLV
ncbi:hypothetical protein EX30DRAFT_397144 [Ascodesmis nigricans]|uniref:Uncharacterized protein n=1 Tax=Ascodesmis nigricans TaxID=341454 RepID=A0A4S2MQ71_9PEZI|nr:hypothetical protein EX30DRAFT_397144 [Ascodesmis nigricans]